MDLLILIISILLLVKKKIVWVLFSIILLTTNYLGAGSNLSSFPVNHNVSDSGLILFIALYVYLLYNNNFRIKTSTIGKFVFIFYIFLFISILIDLTFNRIGFSSILKTSRHWIFLSAIWIFTYINSLEITKLISYLLKATIIITTIMLFEFVSGIKVFPNEIVSSVSQAGQEYTRASIPSTFTLFFLFLLFTNYFQISKQKKNVYIAILVSIIIASMIRSFFAAMVIGITLNLWLNGKSKLRNLKVAFSIVTVLTIIILATPIVRERFITGFEEIKSFKTDDNIEGNFSFRVLLTLERVVYVFEKPQYIMFGIGNITEKNFPDKFLIGLKDDEGKTIQIDTGDIAWALFFLRLGILGTLIYLLFYFKLLRSFYNFASQNSLYLAMFVFLIVNIFPLSFTGSIITQGHFWLLTFLIYSLTNRDKNNEFTTGNNCNTII
jgi:hypothetical protein